MQMNKILESIREVTADQRFWLETDRLLVNENRGFRSVVFDSDQKMALRTLYVVICRPQLVAVSWFSWKTGPVKHSITCIASWNSQLPLLFESISWLTITCTALPIGNVDINNVKRCQRHLFTATKKAYQVPLFLQKAYNLTGPFNYTYDGLGNQKRKRGCWKWKALGGSNLCYSKLMYCRSSTKGWLCVYICVYTFSVAS